MLKERLAAGELAAVPELSEGLFVGTPRFIEEMLGRFGGRLHTARTRVVAMGQGISVLALEGRGGHRTSKSPAAPRRKLGAQG